MALLYKEKTLIKETLHVNKIWYFVTNIFQNESNQMHPPLVTSLKCTLHSVL